jgi:DNA polymerase elongation subunit (family B)
MTPYNNCNVQHPPFKGAFTSVDVTGPCAVDEIVLQVDYASQYPSSIQALNISHESFSSEPVKGGK